jgi:hypothetical protein
MGWSIFSTPGGGHHKHVFDELAIGLQGGFKELGIDAPIVEKFCSDHILLLGGNVLPVRLKMRIPPQTIIFNLEQMGADSPWGGLAYIDMLKRQETWDFSRRNIYELSEMLVDAKLCEIGYAEGLTRIEAEEKDIDVLFYGSVNRRRQRVLDELIERGLNVASVFAVYGQERDALIARAKVVLNVHFYEMSKLFEIVRVSYLMANKVLVVSEVGLDEALEDPYRDGIIFSEYEGLVEKCCEAVAFTATKRQDIADRGYEIFSARPQSEFLQPLI